MSTMPIHHLPKSQQNQTVSGKPKTRINIEQEASQSEPGPKLHPGEAEDRLVRSTLSSSQTLAAMETQQRATSSRSELMSEEAVAKDVQPSKSADGVKTQSERATPEASVPAEEPEQEQVPESFEVEESQPRQPGVSKKPDRLATTTLLGGAAFLVSGAIGLISCATRDNKCQPEDNASHVFNALGGLFGLASGGSLWLKSYHRRLKQSAQLNRENSSQV